MSVREIAGMPLLDTWHNRMQNIKTLLHIPSMHGSKDRVSMAIGKRLNGIFDRFWLDQMDPNYEMMVLITTSCDSIKL